MLWNSEPTISWLIPCATWTLALIAYVTLHLVEKRRELVRPVSNEPEQMRQPQFTGMEAATEHP